VGGRIGVAALDTETGQRMEYRPNERFPMCSTFKVFAAAVLKLVDERKEDLLSPPSRRQLETGLAGTKTGAQMISAGGPTTWRVGDKTGRGANGATNDVAVLRPPNRPPVFLAIYSVGSAAPANERTAAVAEVARVVAAAFQAEGQKSR
jgi:beta-lactamase class A